VISIKGFRGRIGIWNLFARDETAKKRSSKSVYVDISCTYLFSREELREELAKKSKKLEQLTFPNSCFQ